MRARHPAPLPLLAGFAAFVVLLVYLVAASLTRREAPVFAPSPAARARAADWARAGDTLTLDATSAVAWRYASLAEGRALAARDTARWELGVRRHRLTVAGELADLGAVAFGDARLTDTTRWVRSRAAEDGNAADRWYRYGFVTHLLEPNGHVYALRTHDGGLWKLQVIGYYCPGVRAGCLTVRYAPMAP